MAIQLQMATQDLHFQTFRNENAKSKEERDALLVDPGFGKVFTDHMVDICWSDKGGWHRPRVQPYGPISMDPAAAVLHKKLPQDIHSVGVILSGGNIDFDMLAEICQAA